MERRLNWRRDLPDFRDLKLAVTDRSSLPKAVDLRPKMSPVVDQGSIGSCTGNAIAGGLEYLELLELRDNLPLAQSPETFVQGAFQPVSRLFIYYNERVIEGDPSQDNGAELRDGMKAITNYGICSENVWDYSDAHALAKPAKAAYDQAAAHKVLYYYKIEDGNLDHMKRCLVHGYPFVFGFTVYDSFMSGAVEGNGIVPMPKPSESVQGGHAVLVVGYNDAKQWFIVKNSWGTGWGDKGYFFMPYKYLADPNLSSDLWTMRRVP